MEKISEARLDLNSNLVINLDYPKLRTDNGLVLVDCYIINKNHDFENDQLYFNQLNSELEEGSFEIHAISKYGSKMVFHNMYLKSSTFPSFEFTFICLDHYSEYIFCETNIKPGALYINSIIVEGLNLKFNKSSTIKRERIMFGIDNSSTLSFQLDNTEVNFQYFNLKRKRFYNFNIGLIENTEDSNSIVLKFFGENLLPYSVYKIVRLSIKFFLSYIAGNNIIIRTESLTRDHYQYITKQYSLENLTEIYQNEFLPIYDVHFRHKNLLQDYIDTFPTYLYLDKLINLSEVVYLINQSKKVNIESGFFILLIAIEKLSYNLINSKLISLTNNFVIDNELFKSSKLKLIQKFKEVFEDQISNKEFEIFKSKINNLNTKGKTDNKIDLLLDYAEIEKSDDVNLLFPILRNIAIHEGQITTTTNDEYKNFNSLCNLINTIICNLIQYKGLRFIERKNQTNYIAKKERYKVDYRNYS
ncbi:hypothetical protein N0B16_05810 [Chryseobacterium sp. GMJ5]|uniref:ApeA N-terminal domain-containing protein n=1 Tax=Chryseobacterium gilvum TaxID=2976534 RepID=A0ABT2VVB5_9FLAO|nr:hypothetical protein [Chryseobacterium gilvum]MCU7613946.1 hypothetical protein [Chryseobacterium gilvum]